MISKYDIHPKEIVWANLSYPDQQESKVRPLLIISNDNFHRNSGFFVSVGVTTNKVSDPYLLPLPRKEIINGQLQYDSQIMCKRIVTLDCKYIMKKSAQITDTMYAKVIRKIKQDVLES